MIYAVFRRGLWEAHESMRDQPFWEEHAAFMESLAERGLVKAGGPITPTEFLLVIEADSPETVAGILAEDIWELKGLIRTERIGEWRIVLGGI